MWLMIFTILPIAGLSYVGWHLWHLLPQNNLLRLATAAVIFISVVAFVLNFSGVAGRLPLHMAQVCYETGTSALVILLYTVILFLLIDIGVLLRIVPKSIVTNNGITALVLFVLLTAVFVYGNIHYKNKERRQINLISGKKSEKANALKIVMLSDLHLGYHNPKSELSCWVTMINAENPDLILIAGDIIDGSIRPLIEENMATEFRKLNAPVYACPGNHEYYCGMRHAQKFFSDAGIVLLRDSVVDFNESISIIGRDDRSNRRRKSVQSLVQGVDKSRYVILLDHQPYELEKAENAGVDFQFSGHTHHGQVWPLSWITEAIYENAYGPYRLKDTRYYVSSGMGIWGAKFRIGTCSEYVVATLELGQMKH